jgi:hypothetical protein
MKVELEGFKIFDPRDGSHKPLANPALIIAHLLITERLRLDSPNFWAIIAKLADYCDEHADWEGKGLVL